jgi:hypothetical protein
MDHCYSAVEDGMDDGATKTSLQTPTLRLCAWTSLCTSSSPLFENMSSNATLKSSHEPCVGPADDGPDDSIDGLGLVIDGAEFDVGACTTFVDPWSVPADAELDDAYTSDDSRIGTFDVFKYSSAGISFGSGSKDPGSKSSGFEDPGFEGLGACTTFIDPRSSPGGTELDDACASDDSAGFPIALKYSSSSFSNSSFPSGAELDDAYTFDDSRMGTFHVFKFSSAGTSFGSGSKDPGSKSSGSKSSGFEYPVFDGLGACTTFIDPWSVPAGAELDDAYPSDDSRIGTFHVFKYSSAGISFGSGSKSSGFEYPGFDGLGFGCCTCPWFS